MINKFMEAALLEAKKSYQLGEVPVGAVIVKEGQIIGRGFNQKESTNDATAHAEIIAIKEACKTLGSWRLDDCSMYVTLEPCPMCAGAILEARIKRVYIGAESDKSGAAGTVVDILNNSYLGSKTEVYFGIMEEECKTLLKDFFENLRE
ncbi:tRNA adenosine(34) deaminase TadA [Thermoanaerobacter brockii subsp. lactiethylicus]|jgi:tRNA(adenine34) deaminase|uniref:tRNA-specific adenosine deaminase n=2 Tax=Thermoanaerobacter TaxID=1754 RepID=B0K804_THEP3|nr:MULTISPECIES: tRNA adenosine(34) deaminase TadA [Thermoanaerobacter]ABY91354.1 CMP/dCMP deaminase, zinc-binding [Thermoanaerobacter sp. X514]ABY95824.1 CMP/dCMP deaminase, zinc-binding [Thermoanaerobacter pseudethanolicus ATCC 33223]ADV80753.1 CMP/dCMP deaminase zinc-binding protein [Thermoanaerobacter brockii subsp. finnii Ako-1]HBW59045.1 nucleoside deaminase [Thermoanaerobacter sp.]HCD09365.1 nucleoside deaminase [Thermoanaerobacter sp.]